MRGNVVPYFHFKWTKKRGAAHEVVTQTQLPELDVMIKEFAQDLKQKAQE
jgi:hypothetical protein